MSGDLFISFSTVDLPLAKALHQGLEQRGIDCWICSEDIRSGEEWPQAIMRGLQDCRAVVIVLSDKCNDSPYVAREVERAVSLRRPLLVVRADETEPRGNLEFFLMLVHFHEAWKCATEETVEAVERWYRELDLAAGSTRRPLERVPDRPDWSCRRDWLPLYGAKPGSELQQALNAVAAAMIADRTLAVRRDRLSPSDLACLEQQAAGFVLQSDTLLAVPHPQACRSLLADYLEPRIDALVQADSPEHQALVTFSPLAEAAALTLARDWESRGADRWRAWRSSGLPAREKIAASALTALAANDVSARVLREAAEVLLEAADGPVLESARVAAQGLLAEGRIEGAVEILQVLRTSGDSRVACDAAGPLGRCLLRLGRSDEAHAVFQEAHQRADEIDDARRLAVAVNNLALGAITVGADDATRTQLIERLNENVKRLEDLQDNENLGVALNHLACLTEATDPHLAEQYYRQDVALCESADDGLSLTDALDRLGVFLSRQRRFDDAEAVFRRELKQFEVMFEMHAEARAWGNLGQVLLTRGYHDQDEATVQQAVQALQKSQQRFLQFGAPDPRLFAPTLENLGRGRYLLGQQTDGVQRLMQSVDWYRKFPEGVSRAEQIEAELGV